MFFNGLQLVKCGVFGGVFLGSQFFGGAPVSVSRCFALAFKRCNTADFALA